MQIRCHEEKQKIKKQDTEEKNDDILEYYKNIGYEDSGVLLTKEMDKNYLLDQEKENRGGEYLPDGEFFPDYTALIPGARLFPVFCGGFSCRFLKFRQPWFYCPLYRQEPLQYALLLLLPGI